MGCSQGDDDEFGGELFANKAKVDEEKLLSNMIEQTAQDWNKYGHLAQQSQLKAGGWIASKHGKCRHNSL